MILSQISHSMRIIENHWKYLWFNENHGQTIVLPLRLRILVAGEEVSARPGRKWIPWIRHHLARGEQGAKERTINIFVQVWSMLINFVHCMNMYESSKVALISYTSIEQTGIICLWNCMKPHRRCQVSSNLAQPNICIDCSAARPFQQESLYMLQGLLWQGEHQHQAQCRQCQKCWAMISGKPSKAPKPWCHGAVAKRPSLHSHKSMSKATARLSGPWSRNKKLLHAMLMLCLWCVKFTPCATST